jgi:hypothetical protein
VSLRSNRFSQALLLSAVLVSCNSDRPEPAEVVLSPDDLRVRITRTASHPFLSRYRLVLLVERSNICTGTMELFPDTGYAGRRNLYRHASGEVSLVGQYDVRRIEPKTCAIQLIEFRAWDAQALFLGSFDLDQEKMWQFIPAAIRPELPFEKQ